MTPAERARLNRDLADVAHRVALVATRLDQIEVPGRSDARSLRRIALACHGHAAFLARLECLSRPTRRRGQPARGAPDAWRGDSPGLARRANLVGMDERGDLQRVEPGGGRARSNGSPHAVAGSSSERTQDPEKRPGAVIWRGANARAVLAARGGKG